jgi:hypothetical protein
MSVTTLSSREFARAASRARSACKDGPVVITDHGQPAHVLLTFSEYQRLSRGQSSIVDLLAMEDDAAVDFEPPRLMGSSFRPADLG